MGEKSEPDLSGLNAEQLRYVLSLRETVAARTVRVSTNGRFPHWSMERYITTLTFLSVIIGGIWFAGGEWQLMKINIASLTRTVDTILGRVEASNVHAAEMQRQIDRLESAAVPRIGPARPTVPVFPAQGRPAGVGQTEQPR